ncbi:MAG: hypothetical protein KZQ66_11810 [Candidatus Thiodiazotropha sp. (ex Lucinoma aequizonata)]|nr:hypothetical protein [Candidatus Thiodiazotropha sp. (ex Lucinoma aequizonata)]
MESEKRRESQLPRKHEAEITRIQIEETRPEQTLVPETRGKGAIIRSTARSIDRPLSSEPAVPGMKEWVFLSYSHRHEEDAEFV